MEGINPLVVFKLAYGLWRKTECTHNNGIHFAYLVIVFALTYRARLT
jgi:hypothetical protein